MTRRHQFIFGSSVRALAYSKLSATRHRADVQPLHSAALFAYSICILLA